jgi:hypothetical protein
LPHVEEQGPGGVRDVGRVFAREPEPHVILRQQHAGDPGIDVGLVPAQPEQLRRRESRKRPIARQLDELTEAEPRLDLGAFRAGPLIVPEDRGTENAISVVEGDEPVHLAGEADAGDAVRADSRQRRLGSPPPVLGVLLCPARLRRREPIALLGARDDLPARRDP